MNIFQKGWCRFFQKAIYFCSPFLPWRQPELLDFDNGIKDLPQFIEKKGIKSVLLVTGPNLYKMGAPMPIIDGLKERGINCTVYHDTVANPTIENVEEALKLYRQGNCECIVAFGGGSPMDCAKVVGARVARPKKPVSKMKGLLKIRKKIPTFIAIPTTAGTGSETTLAAVISNSETHEKYAINDHSIIPHYAILDASLTVGLPPKTTATTGIDALTHAVEAYIGKSNTKQTKEMAEKAVKLIFDNILKAYEDGSNLEARENMLKGSYYAGVAFTRAYVGYVHAIAHTLGGFYHVAHGLANSVILPYVLEYYGKSAHKKLARLADITGISAEGDSDAQKAQKFIDKIKEMNKKMDIPEKFEGIIKEEDIPVMVERAYKEANPLYPVPKFMGKKELEEMYRKISC